MLAGLGRSFIACARSRTRFRIASCDPSGIQTVNTLTRHFETATSTEHRRLNTDMMVWLRGGRPGCFAIMAGSVPVAQLDRATVS